MRSLGQHTTICAVNDEVSKVNSSEGVATLLIPLGEVCVAKVIWRWRDCRRNPLYS